MNFLYDNFRNLCLQNVGTYGILQRPIRLQLVQGSYTPSQSTDVYRAVIPSGAQGAISAPLTGKTTVAGAFNCAPIAIPAVSGATVVAYVAYFDLGSASNDVLIAYWDTVTGIPFAPTGSTITIEPDPGVGYLFKL